MTATLDPKPYVSSFGGSRYTAAEAKRSPDDDLTFAPRDEIIERSPALRRLIVGGAPEASTLLAFTGSIRNYRPSLFDIDVAAQIADGVGAVRQPRFRISASKDVTLYWCSPHIEVRVKDGQLFGQVWTGDLTLLGVDDAVAQIISIVAAADEAERVLNAVIAGAALALNESLFSAATASGIDMDEVTAAVEVEFGYGTSESFAAYVLSRTAGAEPKG